MGFWDFLGLNSKSSVTAPASLPLVSSTTANVPPDAGGGTDASSEFSLTETSNAILRATLSGQDVVRYGNPDPVKCPVKEVSLKPTDYNYVPDAEQAIPHGEGVTLEILLGQPAQDYDPVSLNAAILSTLSAIPSLAGKVAAKPAKSHQQTYGDVWKELKPLLEQKQGAFTAQELAMIDQFFVASQGKPDQAETWEKAIKAHHNDGKVWIDIQSKELPKDGKAVASADERIAEYFKTHHDHILAQVKAKAFALGILQPNDLVNLDMSVETTGYNVAVGFGTKATVTTDAQTGAPLTAGELAKKMTETPLSKIDTKKIENIFTEVLLASGKELPPMLPRIMDGHMLSQIISARTNNDPAIGAVLANHEMFKSEEDIKAQKEAVAKQHAILLNPAQISQTADRKPMLTLDFQLPEGKTLTGLQEEIVNAAAQMRVGAQPRGMARGAAA